MVSELPSILIHKHFVKVALDARQTVFAFLLSPIIDSDFKKAWSQRRRTTIINLNQFISVPIFMSINVFDDIFASIHEHTKELKLGYYMWDASLKFSS